MCRKKRGGYGNRAYRSPPFAEVVSVGRDYPRQRASGKSSSKNKQKKSTAFEKLYSFTLWRKRRSFQFSWEKGRNFPFPHSSLKYCRSLAGSARTGNRGLVLPHSADHAETLTPPIVLRDKRFTFGQSEMPCYRLWAYLSNKWSCPTGT